MGDSLDEQTIHNSCISSTGVSTSIEGYEEKHSTNSCSTPSIVDLVSLMDGSVHDGSNSWSQQDMASRNQPPEDPSDYSDGSDISDVDEESNVTIRRRVFSLLYLDDEYPTRPVVPIGPAFQAEIPVRVGTCTKNNCDTLESTKYIGIRFWPSEDRINETLLGSNGPGRHELCSRKSPGSANRMKRRVYKSTRKFDEMGEEVSKTWTMREENQFETLMKTNPPVNQASFWDKASKCIPTKSKNSILSYYYNVYIRKRSNMQLRSSTEQIISHNNQPESEE
ncbi:AT-rich interactive domain-containing protein 1-like [Eucalyptus grandis]|uniref:AT-rich interactive domain-containing protein 1-like n=1 Tax=Eucalyptus grandis TaxID=71139 RepID=UPI00192EEBD5|nr:AT-rich interactive domain-containing protein 1-like [Eucalyptus grandis]